MELYRILAIDYGEKRIGTALSDPMRMIGRPYEVVANDGRKWEKLADIIAKEQVGFVVIGLPLNFEGEDTVKTKEVREFAREFSERITLPCEFVNESFTTVDANEALKKMGYGIKESKKVIDKVAAALILRNYLEN